MQGAKKIIFTACHSGKLKRAFTSPEVISTSLKSFLTSRIEFTVLLLIEFLKNINCPSGKLKTEFTSPIAKSTSPELLDTTFFARCNVFLVEAKIRVFYFFFTYCRYQQKSWILRVQQTSCCRLLSVQLVILWQMFALMSPKHYKKSPRFWMKSKNSPFSFTRNTLLECKIRSFFSTVPSKPR